MRTTTSGNLARSALTLLEVVVAAAILTGLLAMVSQAIVSGARTSEVANLKSDAVRQANNTVHRLALELRYVAYQDTDGDGVADPRFTGPVTSGNSEIYTYRVASGLSKSGPTYATLCDRRLIWDKTKGSLTLTSYNADNASLPATSAILVTGGIPLTYEERSPSGTTTEPGFAITRTGASLQLHLNLRLEVGDATEQHQEWVSKQTAIFLRQSLANKGLVAVTTESTPAPPAVSGPMTMSGTVGAALSFAIATSGGVPTAYAATGLPPGLSCNTATGEISGIPGIDGTFSIAMTASNLYGQDTQTCVLTVIPAVVTGNPPVVTSDTLAGQVRSFFSYQVVATNMAKKDKPVGYEASSLPAGLSLDTSTGLLSGTPTSAGTFSVIISATNADGTGTGTFIITILPAAKAPPVVPAMTTIGATANAACTFQITATNMGAIYNPVGYQLTNLPAGFTLDASNGVVTGTPTVVQTVTMTATATNGDGSGSGSIQLVVSADPNCPTVTAGTMAATYGVAFTYAISATNMANKDHPVGYNATGLPAGLTIDTNTGIISGKPTDSGKTWQVVISATNKSGTGTNTLTITIPAYVPTPMPPVIPTLTTISGIANTAFSFQIPATNMTATYKPVGYSLASTPAGITLDPATGIVSGVISTPQTIALLATAVNADGQGSGTIQLIITADPNAPVVNAGTVSATWGNAFQYVITATNMANSNKPVGYAATGLPAGLTIDTSTGVISGTPTDSGKTWLVTISATNKSGTGSNSLTITIPARVPSPPVVTAGSGNASVGTAYSYQIVASNTGSLYAPITYEADGLPFGLLCDTSGKISGSPTQTGSFVVTLKVGNMDGTGSSTLNLVVTDPNAPTVGGGTVNGSQGTALSYQVSVGNVKNNATLIYQASNLPNGLSISSTGLISGTPTYDGTWDATITVTNQSTGGSVGSNVLNFVITNPSPPVLSAQSQSIYTGIAASFQISATLMDAIYGPQGYTATGLPSGMSVNATTGVISGTATTSGTYPVTITARNEGGTGTATLTLSVEAALTEVTITSVKVKTNANGGKVAIDGSYFWVRPPTGYNMTSGNISVTKSSSQGTISYTVTSNPSGGFNVALTGTIGSGTATVNATATKSGSSNKTGSASLTFP